MRWFVLLLFGLSAALVGCAPSVSPLYRDYDIEYADGADASEATPDDAAIRHRIRAALADAGWTEASASAPNAISTEPRTLSDWGLYRTVVTLDVVPVGEHHVRVLFHPARRFITGGRSKIPYLGSGLRAALLPDLNEAFEAQGLYPIGTPRDRDRDEVTGT